MLQDLDARYSTALEEIITTEIEQVRALRRSAEQADAGTQSSMKRAARLQAEAERAAKVADIEKTIEAETEKLNKLTSEAAGEGKDAEKVKILGAIASARAEIEKEERERKFNADEMCYVASERSLVGAQCKPDASADSDLDYEAYAKKHGDELEALAKSVCC